jgi:hypothetical protein
VDSDDYTRVLSVLETIRPEIYRGGPDPELAFESKWHLDYVAALACVKVVAHHVFFQNRAETYSKSGVVYSGLDVVFMKYAVN